MLRLAAKGKIDLILPQAVVDEAASVFADKFPERSGVLDEFLTGVDFESPVVTSRECLIAARFLRDPGDAPILAAILAAKPDFAVTGDKDLLTEEVRAIAPTCRCAEYLAQRTDH